MYNLVFHRSSNSFNQSGDPTYIKTKSQLFNLNNFCFFFSGEKHLPFPFSGARLFGESVLFTTLPQPWPPEPRRAPLRGGSGGAAVLFAGSWRYEGRTLATIERHLVRPLDATVLCVLSGESKHGWRQKGQLRTFFPALAGGE